MIIHKKSAIMILLIGLLTFAPDVSFPQANNNIDVVLVMDSSGSMKKTDPLSLRIPAAKLFISLLDDNDRAGIIRFSDKGYPLMHLTPVDSESNKDRLLSATDKITSTGLYTNLYDALGGGYAMLSEDRASERTKIIILMSDGMMDVGDPDEDKNLVDKMRNEMTQMLEDNEVKVFTIAFTEQSDRKLLQKISKRTGGFYNLALTDRDFHLIFTSIFESLKIPEMLPMSNNGFLVDNSVQEVTIVATKGGHDTRIHLKSPDGNSYSHIDNRPGVNWFVSDNFDMITIKEPIEGRWEILFSAGESNKAYIITNLKLLTDFDTFYSTFGEPLEIKIWLEKAGSVLREQDVLDKIDIYIELTGPDSKTTKLMPFNKGKGIFSRRIAPFTPGNYRMRIAAQGMTFEREKTFVFNVADTQESKEDIKAEQAKKEKIQKQAQAPEKKVETANISWKNVIIQFIAINIGLGIMVFLYIKRETFKNITKRKYPLHVTRSMDLTKAGQKENEQEERRQEPAENGHEAKEAGNEEEVKQNTEEKTKPEEQDVENEQKGEATQAPAGIEKRDEGTIELEEVEKEIVQEQKEDDNAPTATEKEPRQGEDKEKPEEVKNQGEAVSPDTSLSEEWEKLLEEETGEKTPLEKEIERLEKEKTDTAEKQKEEQIVRDKASAEEKEEIETGHPEDAEAGLQGREVNKEETGQGEEKEEKKKDTAHDQS